MGFILSTFFRWLEWRLLDRILGRRLFGNRQNEQDRYWW
jgi:hypothetical protein